jgi:hypothetical protein
LENKPKYCERCGRRIVDADDDGGYGLCYDCAECSHTLVHWLIDHPEHRPPGWPPEKPE